MLLGDRGHPRTAGGQLADMLLLLLFHILSIIQSRSRSPAAPFLSWKTCPLHIRDLRLHITACSVPLPDKFTQVIKNSWNEPITNITSFFPNLWRFLIGIPHHLVQGAGFISLTLHSTVKPSDSWRPWLSTCVRFCALHYPEAQGRLHGNSFECNHVPRQRRCCDTTLGPRVSKAILSEGKCVFLSGDCEAKAAAPKGRLQWTTIRGTLVKQLTDQKVTSFKASVSGKSLPLNVWLQKGYKQEVVEGCPNYWCPD